MIMQEKKVSHLLHLVLTMCTLGCWSIMWFIVWLSVSLENGGIRRKNRKFYEQEKKEAREHAEYIARINSGRYVK